MSIKLDIVQQTVRRIREDKAPAGRHGWSPFSSSFRLQKTGAPALSRPRCCFISPTSTFVIASPSAVAFIFIPTVHLTPWIFSQRHESCRPVPSSCRLVLKTAAAWPFIVRRSITRRRRGRGWRTVRLAFVFPADTILGPEPHLEPPRPSHAKDRLSLRCPQLSRQRPTTVADRPQVRP